MKIEPPYKHFVQKPYLCGPTCIQMILLRRGVWIDQEQIAKETGARVLSKYAVQYVTKLPTTKDEHNVGLWLKEFRGNKVQAFLRKRKLQVEVFYKSAVANVRDLIEENVAKGNDVVVNFWAKSFYKNSNWGHYSLASAIERNRVTLCDPYPSHKSFWEVSVDELIKSMGKQFDGNERGFVVFSPQG